MPKIKHKTSWIERQVSWTDWSYSKYNQQHADWDIIDPNPLPVLVYHRNSERDQFQEFRIMDIDHATNILKNHPTTYRFDELDPKTLKIKRDNPKPKISPIKINLNWYKKLTHDSKVMVTIAIVTLIAMIVIGIVTVALM